MNFNIFNNVQELQFYQEKKGEIILRIVKRNTYSDNDTKYIKKEMKKRLGDGVNLEIQFVDNIPRTPIGKHRFLVQKLPIESKDQ